jgi:hypothetical protein
MVDAPFPCGGGVDKSVASVMQAIRRRMFFWIRQNRAQDKTLKSVPLPKPFKSELREMPILLYSTLPFLGMPISVNRR